MKSFTIDVGNGETFAPYDPDVPKRVAAYAKSRGYVFPDTQEFQEKAFGLGWYKYAPEIAEKLLTKNGFKQDKDGKWLKPDGKPFKSTTCVALYFPTMMRAMPWLPCSSGRSSASMPNVLSIADNDGLQSHRRL